MIGGSPGSPVFRKIDLLMLRVLLVAVALVLGSSIVAVAGPDDDARAAIEAMKRADWGTAAGLWTRVIDSGRLGNRQLVPAYGNRATCYTKLEKWIEALADFSKSIELAPGSNYPPKYVAYSYSNRAAAYIKLKRYELAIQDADQAVRLNDRDHVAYYNRGRARKALGRREAAIADFRAALGIEPNHQGSRRALQSLGVQ